MSHLSIVMIILMVLVDEIILTIIIIQGRVLSYSKFEIQTAIQI